MGVTCAILQKLGTTPVDRLRFTMWVSGSTILGRADLNIRSGILSNIDLLAGNLFMYASISILDTSSKGAGGQQAQFPRIMSFLAIMSNNVN